MLLVIDNFDSFTYNLVQYLEQLGVSTAVYRNNAITISEAQSLNPNRILISPGPLFALRGWRHPRDHRCFCKTSPHSRCLPWTSSDSRALWRENSSGQNAHAWENLPHSSQSKRPLSQNPVSLQGNTLPLTHRRKGHAP